MNLALTLMCFAVGYGLGVLIGQLFLSYKRNRRGGSQ